LLSSTAVWAAESEPVPPASSEMTQEDYAAYRAGIQKQLEVAQQAERKDETQTTTRHKPNEGYGQGYRERQQRTRGNGSTGRASGHGR
ncbi:MAG: hypothetical protein GW936_10150, partial [Gallionella sp.]|nr:hypothetical protein [Gallionella sp.]